MCVCPEHDAAHSSNSVDIEAVLNRVLYLKAILTRQPLTDPLHYGVPLTIGRGKASGPQRYPKSLDGVCGLFACLGTLASSLPEGMCTQ